MVNMIVAAALAAATPTAAPAAMAAPEPALFVVRDADMVLRHIADAEGKPVEGLETLQLQIDMFNHLPPAAVTSSAKVTPAAAAGEISGLSKTMGEMQASWKRGDQAVFVRMLDQLK